VSSRERLRFRVARLEGEGALVPSDGITAARMRERGYRIGETVLAALSKPRNPGYHRLAHALGAMAVEQLPGFERLDAHGALKRLQVESGVGCEELMVRSPRLWSRVIEQVESAMGRPFARVLRESLNEAGAPEIPVRVPRSLAFSSMDQSEFESTVRGIARHIAEAYWPELDEDAVLEMAEIMPEVA